MVLISIISLSFYKHFFLTFLEKNIFFWVASWCFILDGKESTSCFAKNPILKNRLWNVY